LYSKGKRAQQFRNYTRAKRSFAGEENGEAKWEENKKN
jgi:hypothetical protein